MRIFALYLIGLSIATFLAATFLAMTHGEVYGIVPEGFSRASTNIALIAIAIGVWWRDMNGKKE